MTKDEFAALKVGDKLHFGVTRSTFTVTKIEPEMLSGDNYELTIEPGMWTVQFYNVETEDWTCW